MNLVTGDYLQACFDLCVCTNTHVSSVGLLTSEVPQILINKEALPHLNFDVELLGYCDDIVRELTHRMKPDWEEEGSGAVSRPHPSSEQGEHLPWIPATAVYAITVFVLQ